MHLAWEEFRTAGWIAWLILLVGLVAIPAAVAAVALTASGSRHTLVAGIAATLLGAVCAGLGAGGVLLGHRMTNRAIEGESIQPVMKERIRRMGYMESRSAARVGLFFGALPLLAGAIALGAGVARARGGARPAGPPPAPPGGPFGASPLPTAAPEGGGGIALPAGVFAAGLLSVATAFALMKSPLPGRDLDPNDSTWELLEAIGTVESGDLEHGCKQVEESFGHAVVRPDGEPLYADPAKAPGFTAAVALCVDREINNAVGAQDPGERRGRLASIKSPERRLKPDEAQTRRIDEELAKVPPPEGIGLGEFGGRIGQGSGRSGPQIRMGATSVSGRLPPEVIQRIVRQNFGRFRLCYEKGLATKPDLTGRVAVRFTIGRDGSVQGAPSDAGSDLPDQAVVACIVRAFASFSFPEPEGGIVNVVYPIMFSPGSAPPTASAGASAGAPTP